MEQAVVSDSEFSIRRGIWGNTVRSVNLDNVEAVRITSKKRRGRRGRQVTAYYIIFSTQDSEVKFPIGSKLSTEAAKAVVERMTERGITVANHLK